jgi:hypothetical protein
LADLPQRILSVVPNSANAAMDRCDLHQNDDAIDA